MPALSLSSKIKFARRAPVGEYPAKPVFRFATPADEASLERVAALDSVDVPRGDVLVATVRGEVWAAVSVDYEDVAADPFRPTGELLWTLLEQAREFKRRTRRGRYGAGLPLVRNHQPRMI